MGRSFELISLDCRFRHLTSCSYSHPPLFAHMRTLPVASRHAISAFYDLIMIHAVPLHYPLSISFLVRLSDFPWPFREPKFRMSCSEGVAKAVSLEARQSFRATWLVRAPSPPDPSPLNTGAAPVLKLSIPPTYATHRT